MNERRFTSASFIPMLVLVGLAALSIGCVGGASDDGSGSSTSNSLSAPPAGTGPYAISLHANHALSLEFAGGSSASGAALELEATDGAKDQSWSLELISGSGYTDGYHIVSVGSGACLDLDSQSKANGTNMQQILCQSGTGLTQVFQFNALTNGAYQIKNVYTGNCIDAGASLTNGARPEQWGCNTTYANQAWDLVSASSTSTGTGSTGGVGASSPGQPSPPAGAEHVACANNSGDVGSIQNALNAKNAVVLSGTCDLGGTTLSMNAGSFLGGPATLDYTGTGYAVQSSANGGTITGVTFNGGGVYLPLSGGNGWSIVYNTFQNITSGSDGVYIEETRGAATTISHNTFKNIWQGGYPKLPAGMSAAQCGQECIGGTGIFFHNGIDNTTIDYNTLDEIGYDGIKGFWDGFMGKNNPYTGHNDSISNNTITSYHRIGIEVQAAGQNSCPGGCDFSVVPSDGTVAKDNFVYQPALTNNVFAFSLMIGGTNALIINNTGNNDESTCYVRAGIGLENSMDGGTLQGNVIGSVPQSCSNVGWAGWITSGYTQAGKIDYFQNNVICGPNAGSGITVANDADPDNSATMVETADLWTDTCPVVGNLSSSHIVLAYTSPAGQSFPSGGDGTFKLSAVSNLSIKQVAFFVDNATTPVVTQELQDVNASFVSNHEWLYHATFSTTSLASGSHTLKAEATDVSNAVMTASQTFTR